MFSLSRSQQYYFYGKSADMRKGVSGLSGLVRNELRRDPLSGEVFIFINRRRNRMKILVWQPGGFLLYYKQLERGQFEYPSAKPGAGYQISWRELLLILEGIELKSARSLKRFSLKKTG